MSCPADHPPQAGILPLAGMIIVETAERVAGEYVGRLLAELGARVIKIEAAGGAPNRRMGPYHGGESTLFAFLNGAKDCQRLDLASEAGQAAMAVLLEGAHALVDDHSEDAAAALGLSPALIAARYPHLVHCAVTPFGQGAPAGWNSARPLNVINAGGWAWHSPSDTSPEKPPLKGAGRFLSDYEAGIDAALAVLAALHRQREIGPEREIGPQRDIGSRRNAGQFIDIAEVVTQINRVDCVLGRMLAGEEEPNASRTRYDMGGPGTSFACADGHLYLFMTTRAHWLALRTLMGEPAWVRDFPEDWLEFHCTRARVDAFREHFAAWAATRPKHATCEAGQKLGLAIVPVNTAADLPGHPQFAHRGFFRQVAHPPFGEVASPGLPFTFRSGGGGGDGGRSAHAPARAYPPPDRSRGGPLAGVRVLEIAKVWAGPYTGKLLAHLGAEVIKVESRSNLDEMRAYGGVDVDSAPYFLSINQEIRSVTVNMKTAEGLDMVRQMVAASDIVLDNIRPGAMERSHLTFDELRQVRHDIIQVSIKMWGNDGPLGWQTGYAPCFAALSGLTALVGHEGEAPRGMNIRYGDSTAGAFAALGAIAALHRRETTGEGSFVDVSAVECLSSLIGDSLFAHAVTGVVPVADANAHPEMAPHGAYPCAGGEWISIAVATDAEWKALCRSLAAERLTADPRFTTLAGRLRHRADLDAALGAISRARPAAELAEMLRAVGVPAFKSASSLDLVADEFLWARGVFRMVSDHRHGARPIIGPSWRMTPDEASIQRGAPLLGEDNAYLYRDILGLDETRFADLLSRKVID